MHRRSRRAPPVSYRAPVCMPGRATVAGVCVTAAEPGDRRRKNTGPTWRELRSSRPGPAPARVGFRPPVAAGWRPGSRSLSHRARLDRLWSAAPRVATEDRATIEVSATRRTRRGFVFLLFAATWAVSLFAVGFLPVPRRRAAKGLAAPPGAATASRKNAATASPRTSWPFPPTGGPKRLIAEGSWRWPEPGGVSPPGGTPAARRGTGPSAPRQPAHDTGGRAAPRPAGPRGAGSALRG